MRCSRAIAACLLSLALPGAAQAAEDEAHFRIVESRNAETLERDLRRAAAERFRLVAAAQGSTLDGQPRLVALMERIRPSEAVFDYAVVAPPGNLEDAGTLDSLNALGAAGYRIWSRNILTRSIDDWWLPEKSYDAQLTIVLEREAIPRRYAYDSLRLSDPESFRKRLATSWQDGYEVLALVNSARRVRAILSRSLDETESRPWPGDYRLLFNARRHGMRQELKKLASGGYRVVAAAEQSILAPAMVLLQRRVTGGGNFDYKVVSRPLLKQRKDKLLQKLNKPAGDGFRVAPGGITRTDLALERPGDEEPPAWSYRLLSARRPPGLPRALEQARDNGYVFVGLFADALETVVLVEKPL